MNREFLLNILFLLFVNLLIKPFYIFGIDRTIQNTVEQNAYGLYFTFFNLTFLLQIVNDFGIPQFNNRMIAQHPQLLNKYFPNILILKSLLSLGYFLLVFVVAWGLGYESTVFPLIFFIAINQVLISLVFFLRSNISGLGLYRTDSLISAFDKTLLVIICSILLWGNLFRQPFQIEWFIWAQMTSWSLTALIAFWVVRKNLSRLVFRFNLPFLLVILKKSYPFALVVFLMTAYTRVDGVMIERLLSNGEEEAAIYAAAYRLLDAVNMFGFLFAGLLLPMFANLLKKKEKIQTLVDFSFQLIWAGAVPLAITVFFFQKELMMWLYGSAAWFELGATTYYGEVLGYLILTFIAVSGIYIYSTLLTANASLKKMNQLFVGGIILNVALNFLLIPKMQATGAAIATLATQFFIFFGKLLLAKTELNLKFPYRYWLRIIAFVIVIIFVTYQIYHVSYDDWLVKFIFNICLGIIVAFLFGMINIRKAFQVSDSLKASNT